MKATEIFTPGAFPEHTYVMRSDTDLEGQLSDGLETPGQIISVAGPSKSGKTVLIENVVGRDYLIPIQGGSIRDPDLLWDRILDWIESPDEVSSTRSTAGSMNVEGGAEASVGFFGVAKGSTQAKAGAEASRGKSSTVTHERGGIRQVVKEIGGSEFVVLIDDFHYMDRNVQDQVAKYIKEAARLGIKIITAQVPYRGDDVVRANPELRGRVRTLDLDYWGDDDLSQIANTGFSLLNIDMASSSIRRFVHEAAGSPQLMQLICLHSCFVLGFRQTQDDDTRVTVTGKQGRDIFEQTSTGADFRTLAQVLVSGPKSRGQERKVYSFKDGSSGDVYRCVLKGIASDPPNLTLRYDEILHRASAQCDGDTPTGSSVAGTCNHMSRLALDKLPGERVIEWDEQKEVLEIPDPYFLFYLRWSSFLKQEKSV